MLHAAVTTDAATLARSLHDWWTLAGVDTAVDEMPHDWLALQRTRTETVPVVEASLPLAAEAPADAPAPVVTPTMPETLDAFLAWLAEGADHPEAQFATTRVLPQTVANAPLLIVTDMPTVEDMASATLFSSREGDLLAAMLRAIGLDRNAVGIASLFLARPAGGIADERIERQAAQRLGRYIDLMAPQRLLLMGDSPARALASSHLKHDDGRISAMTLPAPAVLLKHAERKAAAWSQLRRIAVRR